MTKNVRALLDGVAAISGRYEAKWRETGEKYNIFQAAGIAHKEVIVCRVLADFLDRRGRHRMGSLYLRQFWEAIAPKLPNCPALDFERARVTPEYVIDENRRVDIAIEDGAIFVPIEVKIWAGDQDRQIADYFAFARTKNRAARVPVLYLTLDGHEPSEASREGAGNDAYVCLSFRDDLLPWLEACLREEATRTAVPVRESLRQLVMAIKSLYDEPEDTEMREEIFDKLIAADDETIKSVARLRAALDAVDDKVWQAFRGRIFDLVKRAKAGVNAELYEGEDYWAIAIPGLGKDKKFSLYLNYDWLKAYVWTDNAKYAASRSVFDKMNAFFSVTGIQEDNTPWESEEISWGDFARDLPDAHGRDDVVPDWDVYMCRLYKLYTERPQEVAERIVAIAAALETA